MKDMNEKKYADLLKIVSCKGNDETIIHHKSKKTVTITENRAPTIESAKFLKELQDEAEKNVISRGKIEDNFMEAKWVHMRDLDSLTECVHCCFKLNQKEYNFKFKIERFPKIKLIDRIISSIKEKVAEVLIYDFAGSEVEKNIYKI